MTKSTNQGPNHGVVGMGNALVDVLARIDDDSMIGRMGLKRGGMELVDLAGYRRLSAALAGLNPAKASGGSARNTIAALAHLGERTAFIGKTGSDENGRFVAGDCRTAGIEPRLTVNPELPTGVASTLISADGQRTFGTYLGAAASLTADDLTPEALEGYDLLYLEGYLTQNHDMVERALELAGEQGLAVALDLASYNVVEADRAFFEYLLRGHINLVFANEEESYAYTREDDAERAAGMLAELTGEAVVKVGARGAIASAGGHTVHRPTPQGAAVVDTTAAGDFFAAGYLAGRMHACPTPTCLDLGNLLGGAVIGVVGTQLAPATWEQLRQQFARLTAPTTVLG